MTSIEPKPVSSISRPYLTGFEYIALIHQASPQQVSMFTRRTSKRIWKDYREHNGLLGNPYQNNLPKSANPTLEQLSIIWNSWTASNMEMKTTDTITLTEFIKLVDPWIKDFRLPQRTDD